LDIGLNGATLTLESDPDLGPGAPLNVLGAATIDSTSRRTLDVRSVITGAAPTSLTLRNVDVDFSGDATNFLGDLIADDASFTMVDITLGGSASAVNGSIFDGTGQINGDLSIADSRLLLTGGDATVPGTLDVLGNLSLDASSTMVANVFLPLVGGAGTIRQSDRVNVTGSAAMDGSLIALYNRDNSVGRLIPLPGQQRTWQLIDSSAGNTGTGTFSAAQLVVSSPNAGTSTVLDLPVNGEVSTALVKITTSFGPAGASITLLGLAALPPDAVVDTACGTYTGSQVNQIVDELILTETNGTADASAVAGAILLYFDYEDMPPAYYATQQRNPYADPDVILDSAAMAGRVAMLRLMQLRDGGIGNAAAKAADASGGRAPDVAAQSQFGAPLNGPTPDEDARVWLRGYGFYEQVDGSDCVGCGYDASIGAAMVGADWATDGGGIVGVFAGLGPGSINYDAFFGTQNEDVEQAMAGLYGSLVPGDGAMYLEGYALGGYYDIDRTRTVSIPNVATRVATSDNSAWGLSVGGELGLNLPIGDETWLQPFGGVTWGQYWGDGYNEQGADSLNLRVGDQSANEWMPTAGARIMHTSRNGRDVLTPFVGAAFLAQLPVGAGWAPTYTSDFNLGVPTQYDEGPIDRYGATVQAGLEFAMGSRATAYIAFDGAWLTGKQRYGGQVGIFVPF
jgi:outer membrane autotransporter protein